MKALSSTVAGNIVPAVSYTAGSYTLTGLVVGNYYYYSMGANDTSITFAGGATFAKSAAANGVFNATATSATLAGSGTSAVGTVVAPMLSIPLFPATVTPTMPARLVTVGQFPANNPNFSRQLQISDQYVFVKRGTYAVAISLNDICSMALAEEVNLTWTPPAILTEPANASCVHSSTSASLIALGGSEYAMSYAWQQSPDNVNWSSAIATGTGIFTVAVNAAGTGYTVGDILTVAGGTHSVTATLEVTSISGGGGTGPITGLVVLAVGVYTVNPSLTANAVTGGTGASATVNLTMAAFDLTTIDGTLTITPVSAGANYYKCTVTDNAGSFGLTNGSSVFSVATITVT